MVVAGLGDPTYRVVEDLQSCGVNMSEIKKLQEAGYSTVGSVLQACTRDLIAIKGFSDAKVEKIREAARKLDIRGGCFKSGLEMKEKRRTIIRITTGSNALDNILGGGIETGSITELFGEFRTGKTQICHTICVTGQLAFESKGGQGKVIYMDTEGTLLAIDACGSSSTRHCLFRAPPPPAGHPHSHRSYPRQPLLPTPLSLS